MSEIVKEVRNVENAIVVVAAGELTLRESPDFHAFLIDLCEKSPARLVINLSEVTFIDSSGVGTLTDIFRRLKKADGMLALVGLKKMVRSVFEITRLDKLLPIFESEQEALES